MTKPGRRPGTSGSRQAINDAARGQFAAQGYGATTIRSIAAEAEVDPALVMHFFGSKDGLFRACVEWPFDPAVELDRILADGATGIGERIVALFVRTWDEEEGRNPIVALLRSAMAHEPSEHLLREFLTNEMFIPLAIALELDEAELRVSLAASQLVGLGIARYVLRVEPLASLPSDATIACVAPTIEAYLTAPLGRAA